MPPLTTTAIAAQSASTLNRETALALLSGARKARAKTPPTQRAKAITWIASEPMAIECEPLDAEWLWKTGITIANSVASNKNVPVPIELNRGTIIEIKIESKS